MMCWLFAALSLTQQGRGKQGQFHFFQASSMSRRLDKQDDALIWSGLIGKKELPNAGCTFQQ
jgi:hypothetical protein